MNRLILIDNLRHGHVGLLSLTSLYFLLVWFASFWETSVLAFIWLGFIPTWLCNHLRPNRTFLGDALRLDSLLAVPRSELINTHWFLRSVFPAAFLATLFAIAESLGMTGRLTALFPAFWPIHLFLAYFGGLSLMFFAGSISKQSLVPPTVALGTIFPAAYLWLVSSRHGLFDSTIVSMLIASLLVGALYRSARARLARDLSHDNSGRLQTSRRSKLLALLSAGFRSLATAHLAYGGTYSLLVLGVVLLISWSASSELGVTTPHNASLLESLILNAPLFSLIFYLAFMQRSPVNLPIRILRVLPFSVEGLTARILGSTLGSQLLLITALGFLAMGIMGFEIGLLLLNAYYFWSLVLSPLLPLALRYRGFQGFFSLIVYYLGVTMALYIFPGLNFLNPGFLERPTSAILLSNLPALVALAATWWMLKRTLTRSSAAYRVELSQTPGSPAKT